jgi:3-oxoadipate enol-lactonase/4-carboxymuconolactone decarboxylase
MAVELHHRWDGPEGAPVVVLGNSLGTTMELWDRQLGALTERFRVLRYDTRGHGGSPVPDGPYTIDDIGADALALLDRLGLERVLWCGVSLGGMTGMWLASRAPERIERLVLCCTSANIAPASQWAERAALVRAEGTGAAVEGALERWFSPEFRAADPAVTGQIAETLAATPAEGYAGCCEAIGALDLRAELPAVRAPTLVIAGGEDPITPPAHARVIRDAIPGATLTVVAGARHLANIEAHEAVTRAIVDHLLRFGARERGMRTRREVLGDAHVDAAIARTTDLDADFQDFITRYAWGDVWTRPALDRRTRSMITLTALASLGRLEELALHVRAARRNGLGEDEIAEVLLHTAIYAGVPAANAAFAVARRVLSEEG